MYPPRGIGEGIYTRIYPPREAKGDYTHPGRLREAIPTQGD